MSDEASPQAEQEYKQELHTYIVGYVLALALTLAAFGLVYWSALPSGIFPVIGGLAVVQGIVHFRCFLKINPPRQNVEDLHLILFSGLLLFFMVGGTVWVLRNLATRMH